MTTMYTQFARAIARRIERGDYTLGGFPSEEAFAEEIGASRKTARRALKELMDEGLLQRKPHGRLEINRAHAKAGDKLQVALLMPAFPSWQYQNWARICELSIADTDIGIRTVSYLHWDDPVILNAINCFDGVLLVPSSEKITPLVLKRLQRAPKLAVLDGDFSEHGIVSLKMNPPRFIHRIGDHLYRLGHRHIDCLNTQPGAGVPIKRLGLWQHWCQTHQVSGQVIDDQVQTYCDPTAHAYRVMNRLLDDGKFTATALVCLTQAAATGAIRALIERGLSIGRDVSVCAVDSAEEGRYLTPSRTAMAIPPAAPYIQTFLQWMSDPQKSWDGPTFVQPTDVSVFEGESTGPAPSGQQGLLRKNQTRVDRSPPKGGTECS